MQQFGEIGAKRNVKLSVEQTHAAPAVQCDQDLKQALVRGVELSDIKPRILASGAGHDAMAMADICPVAMLFTRCKGGISHHPGESIKESDVEASLSVLFKSIENLQHV